jgi:hypothetical protein
MIENNNTSIISDDDDRELNKYEKIDFLNKMLELGDNINNEDYEEENIKLITKKKKRKIRPLARITKNLPSLREKSISPHLIIISIVLFTLLCYELGLKITILPFVIIFSSFMILLFMDENTKEILFEKLKDLIFNYLIVSNKDNDITINNNNLNKDNLNDPLILI